MGRVGLEAMKVAVSFTFTADRERVWCLLTDVERMAGLGPEHREAWWVDERRGVGARFRGVNEIGGHRWEVPCEVTESLKPARFAWLVGKVDEPSAWWAYDMEPTASGGTLVRQTFAHGPGFSFVRASVEARPENAAATIAAREASLRANMTSVLHAAARLLDETQGS